MRGPATLAILPPRGHLPSPRALACGHAGTTGVSQDYTGTWPCRHSLNRSLSFCWPPAAVCQCCGGNINITAQVLCLWQVPAQESGRERRHGDGVRALWCRVPHTLWEHRAQAALDSGRENKQAKPRPHAPPFPPNTTVTPCPVRGKERAWLSTPEESLRARWVAVPAEEGLMQPGRKSVSSIFCFPLKRRKQ